MIEIQSLQMEAVEAMGRYLHEDIVDAIAANVAKAARAEWIRLAGESKLTTTNRDYIAGIQPIHRRSKGEYVVSLVGKLPHILEEGMEETDLRNTLLGPNVPVAPPGQSGKHKSKSGGFYRSIPFSHAGPNAGGGGGLIPMGRPYSGHDMVGDSRALGRDVYAQAKALAPKGDPFKPSGERLVSPTFLAKGPGFTARMQVPKLKPHHKTDIYSGMVRAVQVDRRGREQNTFTTFRTISTDNPEGWIRPATEGLHLAAQVSEYVARIAPMAFEEYVKGLK